MKVISTLARKGGCGKSTLTINLATAAMEKGLKVGIIDLDPQSSLTKWAEQREREEPIISDAKPQNVAKYIEAGRTLGLDLMIIDTPPNARDELDAALALADFVIVPTQVSHFDLMAITTTVIAATQASKPFCVILNRVHHRGVLEAKRLRRSLVQENIPVANVVIQDRVAFKQSLDTGLTVIESETDGKAAAEIRDLWTAISKLADLRAGTRTRKQAEKVA